ncbi:hypothetical protein CBOM_08019 [Ceraceosorus bombacis]|uniref:Uncharacterized protein n=1 Tax=Ceraceosorus bombacis TaxID=401625 RepID=A0A0P1BKS9_9BASI|nr:hypothetical protein CBOM_08019 [Ceraceosorus bombacis]
MCSRWQVTVEWRLATALAMAKFHFLSLVVPPSIFSLPHTLTILSSSETLVALLDSFSTSSLQHPRQVVNQL